MSIDDAIRNTAAWLRNSRSTVVFSGAGMSTESGIPDFRSANGLWTKTDPMEVATSRAMQHQYDLFHEFYSLRLHTLQQCQPHEGHKIIAGWESMGFVKSVATQNVDGFHHAAGSRRVYELHGSLNAVRCIDRGHESTPEQFINKDKCNVCGSRLRPGVVLFGESLPMEAWNKAMLDIQESDLLLVIGTSLMVAPVNQLPAIASGRTVLINQEPVAAHYHFDAVITGKAGEILGEINQRIGEDTP